MRRQSAPTLEECSCSSTDKYGAREDTCVRASDQWVCDEEPVESVQSGGAISSITSGDVPRIAYELMSRVPPPASATMNPCPEGCCNGDQLTTCGRTVQPPYLQDIRSEAIKNTCVKTRFTLCDETDARFPLICVGYEAAVHCGAAHLRLLRALPTIRMAEDELNVLLHRVPKRGAVRMGIDDERARTAEEVCQEVGKDVDRRLAGGERGEAHAVHFEFHVLGSQT